MLDVVYKKTRKQQCMEKNLSLRLNFIALVFFINSNKIFINNSAIRRITHTYESNSFERVANQPNRLYQPIYIHTCVYVNAVDISN